MADQIGPSAAPRRDRPPSDRARRGKCRPSPLTSLLRGEEAAGHERERSAAATPLAIVRDAKDFLQLSASTSTSPSRKTRRRTATDLSAADGPVVLPRKLPSLGSSAPPTRGCDPNTGRGLAAEPLTPLCLPPPVDVPQPAASRRKAAGERRKRSQRRAAGEAARGYPVRREELLTLADVAAEEVAQYSQTALRSGSANSSLVGRVNSHGSTPRATPTSAAPAQPQLHAPSQAPGSRSAGCHGDPATSLAGGLGHTWAHQGIPASLVSCLTPTRLGAEAAMTLPSKRDGGAQRNASHCNRVALDASVGAGILDAPEQRNAHEYVLKHPGKCSEEVPADESTIEADPDSFKGLFSDKCDVPDEDSSEDGDAVLDSVDGQLHPRLKVNESSFACSSSLEDAEEELPAGVVRGAAFSWVRGEVIGRGMLGTVYKALDQQNGQLMAVKEVYFDSQDRSDDKFRAALQNEISLYKDLKHPHIVSYLGDDYISGRLYIYLEFMAGGSIAQVLSQFGAFDEALIARYMRNLVEGLEYLHTRDPPILHRDIKGANILVGVDGTVKLSDFGCSKRSDRTAVHTLRGSVPWMAPEVMKEQGYGRKADIWSLGCVLIEMSTASSPWGHFDNCLAAMVRIAMSQETPPIPEHLSESCRRFTELCTKRTPEERPNATDLLAHEFLSGDSLNWYFGG